MEPTNPVVNIPSNQASIQPIEKKPSKNKVIIICIVGIVLLITAGSIFGYYVYNKNVNNSANQLTQLPQVLSPTPLPTINPIQVSPTGIIEESTKSAQLEVWHLVCEKLDLTDFKITAKKGDSPTTIGRRAIVHYFNNVTLSEANDIVPRLSAEESIYAEDYIRKGLPAGAISASTTVSVPCTLVEDATVKARLLTVNQQQNLEQYSKNVELLELKEMIQNRLDKLYEERPDLKKYSGTLELDN